MLVNEKFVELMGWEDPIGKKVTTNAGRNERDRFISGVFSDYNTRSLHHEVSPLFIYVRRAMRSSSENILVKINMQNIQASLEAIEEAWYAALPNVPIEYEFMNEDIERAYAQEQRAGELSVILSTLAIILAVMGLIGLAAYMARLRIKEVGIHKVLGASLSRVLFLFNKEFIFPLIIATLVGSSLCFYVVNQWLGTFAYRTSIDLIIYPLAGILVLAITLITVSIQSAKTAMQNPVKALRHE